MNILTFTTHEGWQSNWAKTGHTFYALPSPERPNGWKVTEQKKPDNWTEINGEYAMQLCEMGDIDTIVCHTAFHQRITAQRLSSRFNIPIIEMEHCLPLPGWN